MQTLLMMPTSAQKEVNSFVDLKCWQACREVRLYVSSLIKELPGNEKYDLIDNIRRASRSITRSIAEGYGRHHYQENLQFCRISRGSLYEILDDLITAKDENYIEEQDFKDGEILIVKALKLLNGYIRYIEKSKM